MRSVDINELPSKLDEVLLAAKNGETTTITEHGQPIVLFGPPSTRISERLTSENLT